MLPTTVTDGMRPREPNTDVNGLEAVMEMNLPDRLPLEQVAPQVEAFVQTTVVPDKVGQ